MTVPLHDDPGLQPERTALAWTRTALSLMVLALVVARLFAVYHEPVGPAMVIVGIMVAGLVADQVRRLRRFVVGLNSGSLALASYSVLFMGLGSAVLAAVILASMIW